MSGRRAQRLTPLTGPALVGSSLLLWSAWERPDIAVSLVALGVPFTLVERWRPLRRQCSAIRRPGAMTDAVRFVVNEVLAAVGLVVVLAMAVPLLRLGVPPAVRETTAALPGWSRWLLAFVVSEVCGYWWHRLSHEIPALWSLHRVHHSASTLDWLAPSRRHPLDAVVARTSTALPVLVLGLGVPTVVTWFALKRLQGLIVHANVDVRLGALERVIATPFFHHWHHSDEPGTWNTNYAGSIPAVDWLFGTLYPPDRWPAAYGSTVTSQTRGTWRAASRRGATVRTLLAKRWTLRREIPETFLEPTMELRTGGLPEFAMAEVTVLDGGMGRELLRIGAPFRQPEWSALALTEGPDHVVQAHTNFIDAGAQVITTNSYAIVPFHIGDQRFTNEAHELAATSGICARRAADRAERRVLVAGSLPPLFGSYQPELFRAADAPRIIDPLVEGLADHVDVWLGETLGSIDEARAVRDALDRAAIADRPLWISYTLADTGDLRSGEVVADAVLAALDLGADTILFNCCQAETIAGAIEIAATLATGVAAVGGYANRFSTSSSRSSARDGANQSLHALRDDLDIETYGQFVQRWLDAGATVVGGCCGIEPAHIARIASLITQR